MTALAGLAVLWSRVAIGDERLFHGVTLLNAALTAVVVGAAVGSRPFDRVLAVPPLRAVGRISYGAYLFHWPLFLVLTPDRIGVDGWALFGVRAAATLGAAAVSYVVVEAPFRFRLPMPRPRLAALAACGSAAVVLLAVGLPQHPAPYADLASASASTAPPAPGPEAPAGGGAGAITNVRMVGAVTPADGPPDAGTVLLAGDSVAWSLLAGFVGWNSRNVDHTVQVDTHIAFGCPAGRAGHDPGGDRAGHIPRLRALARRVGPGRRPVVPRRRRAGHGPRGPRWTAARRRVAPARRPRARPLAARPPGRARHDHGAAGRAGGVAHVPAHPPRRHRRSHPARGPTSRSTIPPASTASTSCCERPSPAIPASSSSTSPPGSTRGRTARSTRTTETGSTSAWRGPTGWAGGWSRSSSPGCHPEGVPRVRVQTTIDAPPAGRLATARRHRRPRLVDGRRRVHPLHRRPAVGGRHDVRVRDPGRAPADARRHGGHRVARAPVDGRAPPRAGHRHRPLPPAPPRPARHPPDLGRDAAVPVVAGRRARRGRGRTGAEAGVAGEPAPLRRARGPGRPVRPGRGPGPTAGPPAERPAGSRRTARRRWRRRRSRAAASGARAAGPTPTGSTPPPHR